MSRQRHKSATSKPKPQKNTCKNKCSFPTTCELSGKTHSCKTNVGLIVGLVVVALIVLLLIGAALLFLRWRCRRAGKRRAREAATIALSRQMTVSALNLTAAIVKAPKHSSQHTTAQIQTHESLTDDVSIDRASVITCEEERNPPDRFTPRPTALPVETGNRNSWWPALRHQHKNRSRQNSLHASDPRNLPR